MRAKHSRSLAEQPAARWLLLVHQLPPKPAYLRVKIWRRLQGVGAISVRNSVYVLPAGEQALEDFQWLLREVEQGGGEGMICEVELVDGLRDDEVRALFDAARDSDYAELTKELRALKPARKGKTVDGDLKPQLRKLRQRFNDIAAKDFFGATGRLTVEALIAEMERGSAEPPTVESKKAGRSQSLDDLQGRTWVTRRGVHVDRIACAWLIRRFIDPGAAFKFVAEKSYKRAPGELRFDMFQGEYTHQGDKCSLEVLADRLGTNDPALRAIAEIVHDIDLKDQKFAREETAGIAHVIAGICTTQDDDMARIARGSAIFDDTYERFRKKRSR